MGSGKTLIMWLVSCIIAMRTNHYTHHAVPTQAACNDLKEHSTLFQGMGHELRVIYHDAYKKWPNRDDAKRAGRTPNGPPKSAQ